MMFLDALFAPIARLLVARGVLIAAATERLKRQYVRAAKRQAGAPATDSRLSVLTGLQRREVVRLLAEPEAEPERAVNPLARLVALWQADPRFAGRALPRLGEGGFEELAQAIRRDVHPRTMLAELMEAGTVSVDAQDVVRLEQASYQPLAGSEAQLAYLSQNAGDFLTASVENVLGGEARFFERAVHYNCLSDTAVAALEARFRDGQMALLLEINAEAARLQVASPGRMRFRAGGYFYREEQE